MKLLWCVVLVTVCAAVSAQKDDDAFPDYWQNDFDNSYDDFYNEEDGNVVNNDEKPIETGNQDISTQAVTVSQKGQEEKNFDVLEDYQIEDNRSNEKQDADNPGENEDVLVDAPENEEDLAVIPLEDVQQTGSPKENAGEDNANWGQDAAEDVAPLPVPSAEENKDILEETRNILNDDNGNFEDPQDEEADPIDEQAQRLIEETERLLQEDDDAFEADDYDNSDEQDEEKSEEDLFNDKADEAEEDTPQKIYADLNADLDKLFETLDKLTDENSEEDDADDGSDQYVDNIQEYEEKYQKPYREDVVLSWRKDEAEGAKRNLLNEFSSEQKSGEVDENADSDDYEAIDDSNLSAIFAAFANQTVDEQQDLNKDDNQEQAESIEQIEQAAEDNVEGGELKESSETTTKQNDAQETFDYIDNFGEPVDREPSADEDLDSVIRQVFSDDIKEPQSYGNDALTDDKQPKNEDAEEISTTEESTTQGDETVAQTTDNMENLSSAELSDLMTKFVAEHSEDLDVNSESFSQRVAPIRITLSPNEAVVVNSPNWPGNYPSNNIVDWIFEGPGSGIEMNITEFNINGARGDYLLVKPGGLDESGSDGLIFSYKLNSERRYRFVSVDRMFVRFESKAGWAMLKGFEFTVKLIWPLPAVADEGGPVPEPIIMPPNATLVLNLAGISMPQFHEVYEEFKQLVADMAAEYIRDNDIDPGTNTTLQVTQITKTAVCNIHWPNYETCVEVVFGIPLQYDDEDAKPRLNAEDLDTMWTTYIAQEKYASRLRALGITEYAIPNDRTVLMVWLVIAAGVVLSMAMLAFALWRFSCFEDYTRMRSFSDTDSLQKEKRTLDLYPTPHQTLPPLYTENDYKWADNKYDDSTRVDLGGFSNKSYIRDDMFDLDSDDDAITSRDRKSAVSPRDFYDV